MEFKNIYSFDDADIRGALHVSSDDIIDPISIIKVRFKPEKKMIFKHYMGSKPKDLICIGYPSIYLLSINVINVLLENKITGWKSYHVDIYNKNGELNEDYYLFPVTGYCGPIDNKRSKRVSKPPLVPGGNTYKPWVGLFFDLNTWDGKDIFSPKDTTFIFVVEKVKNILEKQKFKNIIFRPITKIERLML
jgi:hypothetical protein